MRGILRPTDSAAVAAAREAAVALGGNPGALRRLHDGTSNTVWRLPEPDVVLTVAPRHRSLAELTGRIAVAGELAQRGLFVRPAPGRALLETTPGCIVAIWQRVPVLDGPLDWTAVGKLLRGVHRTDLAALRIDGWALPDAHDLTAVNRAATELWRRGRLSRRDADTLRGAASRLAAELDALPPVRTLVHGDAHRPNILLTPGGVLLCDVDEFATAHPWWDLAFLLDPGRSPGLAPAERRALEAGYGAPLPGGAAARTLARASHLRRTARELLHGRRSASNGYWNRVRLAMWGAMLEDWSRDLVPAVSQPRLRQLAGLLRPPGR